MNLIAKNRLITYIKNHPEARVELLTWLKEFPYREGIIWSDQPENFANHKINDGVSWPGIGHYAIKYLLNQKAKTILITWVGSKEEFQEAHMKELNLYREKHQDLFDVPVKVEIQLRPPPPHHPIFEEPAKHISQTINAPFKESEPDDQQALLTATEYQDVMERIISIFNAEPDSKEFQELLNMLPSVTRYEAFKLPYPPVYAYEVAKQRMNILKLQAQDLVSITGHSEVEINRALMGDPTISQELMGKIFKVLHLPFSYTDFLHLSGGTDKT